MTLSDFLCLHATLFTYACGDEVGSKSGLFMEQLFPPLHWTWQWTLSSSITPTLFKLQSLNSFKDRFCISWDDLDGSLKCVDAAIFFSSSVLRKILIPSEWNLHVIFGKVKIFWHPPKFKMTFDNRTIAKEHILVTICHVFDWTCLQRSNFQKKHDVAYFDIFARLPLNVRWVHPAHQVYQSSPSLDNISSSMP